MLSLVITIFVKIYVSRLTDLTYSKSAPESDESEINYFSGYTREPEYSNEELKKMGVHTPTNDSESEESEEEEGDSSRMENRLCLGVLYDLFCIQRI